MASSPYRDRVIADGAVAYFRLGETSGTTIASEVGGHTGTISGGVTLNQPGAVVGNTAAAFNGIDGRITTTLQSLPIPLTVEVWLNTTQATQAAYFSNMTGGGGTITFGLITQALPGSPYVYQNVSAYTAIDHSVNDGAWHHLVITLDGSNRRFYVDGVLVGTLPAADVATTNICDIGREGSFTSVYYSGLLDELAIYYAVLTPQQIADHYADRNTLPPEPPQPQPPPISNSPYRDRVLFDGAVGYWRLGETAGTSAYSEVGGYTGTINDGVTVNQPGAVVGNTSMAFNGGPRGVVGIPPGAFLNIGTGPATLECWFQASQPQVFTCLVDFKRNGDSGVPGIGFLLGGGGNTIYLDLWTAGAVGISIGGPFTYADAHWHYIVGVITRGPDIGTLFIDGVQRFQGPLPNTGASLTSTSTAGIGACALDVANAHQPTQAVIDDVAIYHTALTPQQIADHYALRNQGPQKGYLQARGGIARGAAIRGNYFLYNAVIQLTRTKTIDPFVTETVNLSRYVEMRSLQLHEAINDEIDTASFTLKPGCPWIPKAGEPIRIGVGTGQNALFAGQAITVRTRYIHGVDDPWIDVACVDHLAAFDAHLVTWDWPSQPGATIIRDLVQRYTAGFTTVGVANDLPNIAVSAINYRPSTILRTITHAGKGGFYIDPNRDLQAFPATGPLGQLTQPRLLQPALKSLKEFTAIDDATQVRTQVIVEGQRSETLVPLPIQVRTQPAPQDSIPVVDATMFESSPYDAGQWVTPEWRIRIGTQNAMYHYAVKQTDSTKPTGTLVRVAALKGDTDLLVNSLDFILPSEYLWGWVLVGDQTLLYDGAYTDNGGRLHFSQGLPQDVSAGSAVTAVPYLREVYGRDWNQVATPFRPQLEQTAVVLQTWQTQGIAEWYYRMAGMGDGYHDHLVQDGRYSRATALQRGQAELLDFSRPLKRIEWITYDLNAEVGRLQGMQMPPDGYTDLTMQITEVNITWDETPRSFPHANLPPKRSCRAEITKRAELLDYILTDQR